MMPIQELLLCRSFHPDLVLSIGCKEVQGSDVQPEFARLCELS